jgi:hypothetical protein
VHYAPEPPHWTTDPPTHEGKWAVHFAGEKEWLVVEVWRSERGLVFASCRHGTVQSVRDIQGLEWSDRPVKEPV